MPNERVYTRKRTGSKTNPSDPNDVGGRPIFWTNEKVDAIADDFMEFALLPSSLYYKEFISYLYKKKGIMINRNLILLFCERSEKFKEAYEYMQSEQECKILKGGLLKKFDSSMSKFILAANHGYTDRQHIVHEGNETIEIVNYSPDEMKTWNQTKTKTSESV